jgi:hypothetical protein
MQGFKQRRCGKIEEFWTIREPALLINSGQTNTSWPFMAAAKHGLQSHMLCKVSPTVHIKSSFEQWVVPPMTSTT